MRDEYKSSHRGLGMLGFALSAASIVVALVAGEVLVAVLTRTVRTTPASAAMPQIAIASFKFAPATVTVPVGTTVTWVNRDDELHTVTADDGRLSSRGLKHDDQFSYRFIESGTYAYHCALHPRMTARIIVE